MNTLHITSMLFGHVLEMDDDHRRISREILDMAQYFLPVDFDKYIVLDQDLLPFPIQIFNGLAFLYQFSYGPGHRGHNMKYAYDDDDTIMISRSWN